MTILQGDIVGSRNLVYNSVSGPMEPLVVNTVEKALPLSAEAVSIVTSRTIGPAGDQERDKIKYTAITR